MPRAGPKKVRQYSLEHPLLIFAEIPRSTQAGGQLLSFEDLVQTGRALETWTLTTE